MVLPIYPTEPWQKNVGALAASVTLRGRSLEATSWDEPIPFQIFPKVLKLAPVYHTQTIR